MLPRSFSDVWDGDNSRLYSESVGIIESSKYMIEKKFGKVSFFPLMLTLGVQCDIEEKIPPNSHSSVFLCFSLSFPCCILNIDFAFTALFLKGHLLEHYKVNV